MQLVLASGNSKKLAELQQLLAPSGVRLVAQNSLGIPEAPEPYSTFVENALAKARHAAQHAKSSAIADDSGLCVDALDGAPGVLSARYATLFGLEKSDAGNNLALLNQMQNQPLRRARFVSVLVAIRSPDDPEPLIAFGRWEGEILRQSRGAHGFGYDPLVWIPALSRSVAELTAVEKNRYSHRALAAAQMLVMMKDVWH
jgi:XTP/dITP diphosphohydrolase